MATSNTTASNNGEVLTFDPEQLDIGDLVDFEEETGLVLTDAFSVDGSGNLHLASAKALQALVWIVKRHDKPDFTLEDARHVRIAALAMKEPKKRPTRAAGSKS